MYLSALVKTKQTTLKLKTACTTANQLAEYWLRRLQQTLNSNQSGTIFTPDFLFKKKKSIKKEGGGGRGRLIIGNIFDGPVPQALAEP